ncbi:hypothetical protein AVEN_171997-1 [Araneus ventricosus]|uniref:Uncharacterized protein n=1 Tax=Araneus ventricosus TaxID=182803 RepID=A0A4Y2WUI0_ARAVE|nr:hypothetical protein AVEN_171997-1 [Araneus ventricosus]
MKCYGVDIAHPLNFYECGIDKIDELEEDGCKFFLLAELLTSIIRKLVDQWALLTTSIKLSSGWELKFAWYFSKQNTNADQFTLNFSRKATYSHI